MADNLNEEGRISVLEDLALKLLLGRAVTELPFGFDKGAILQQLSEALKEADLGRAFELWIQTNRKRPPAEDTNVGQHQLSRRLDTLLELVQQTRLEQLQMLLLLSHNPAFANQRFRRAIPMSVFISENDPSYERGLERALHELATEIDFEIVFERPGLYGSWFKDAIAKSKSALTSKEVQDNLQKVQRGLELKHLYREQAKADLDLSKAAKNISEILAKQKNGVVLLGSICGLKTTHDGVSSLVIVALTQEQMLEIANNPQLRVRPKEMLEMLKITERENHRAPDFRFKTKPRTRRATEKKTEPKKLAPPSTPSND